MGQIDRGLGENTLEMGKTGWGSGDTGSWGVNFTQQTPIFHGGTKKSPMRVLGSPSWLFLRERERSEKNGEGGSSVRGFKPAKTG
jgi:hypothetical protein